MTNKEIAQNTLSVLKNKSYITPSGNTISIEKELDFCLSQTQFFESEQLEEMFNNIEVVPKFQTEYLHQSKSSVQTIIELSNLEENFMCLNFASAKNPGGGFLNGAEAQEESLARTSALYESQLQAKKFYDKHKKLNTCLYSDSMIYSPKTPLFRNDKGVFLEKPIFCNFITSAAVNAGVIHRQEQSKIPKIESFMEIRIKKLLTLCYAQDQEVLILGAWGCGVFKNDPVMIANLFSKHLEGKFRNAFRKIVFAIFSKNESFHTPFIEIVSKLSN